MRQQIRTLDHAELDSEAVEIVRVRRSGNQAVAEVKINTAVRMRQEGNNWLLEEVRLGDRRWESIDRILKAIEQSRYDQTVDEMDQVEAGIRKYIQERGEVPLVESFDKLIDTLNPRFLSAVIRIDPWWNPYSYRTKNAVGFELRSAGPDGKFGTADDLVRD